MNTLIEWFGLDSGQFNEVTLNFVTKDMSLVWILALVLVPLALWFFWTSLKRIQSPRRKIFLISLRLLTFLLLVFILLKPELEFKKSHILKNVIVFRRFKTSTIVNRNNNGILSNCYESIITKSYRI